LYLWDISVFSVYGFTFFGYVAAPMVHCEDF
jgi:hypothetical protein